MLTGTSHNARAGATVAELLVALVLAAVVLGTATSSLLRQRRTAIAVGGAATSSAQLRAATGALAAELSALSAGAGDLVPGEARDTALQLRALVAGGTSCADGVGGATYADDDDSPGGAPWSAPPRAGDSLWWFAADSTAVWRGRRITGADGISATCAITGAPAGPAWRVSIAAADTIPAGAHLRVTRPARYSFYRSGDGTWQLGQRDWLDATGRFAAPQPIAGPFVMQAGADRTGFRYFDAGGVELSGGAGGVDAERVARLRVTLLVLDRSARGTRDSIRRDSVDVALHRASGP